MLEPIGKTWLLLLHSTNRPGQVTFSPLSLFADKQGDSGLSLSFLLIAAWELALSLLQEHCSRRPLRSLISQDPTLPEDFSLRQQLALWRLRC